MLQCFYYSKNNGTFLLLSFHRRLRIHEDRQKVWNRKSRGTDKNQRDTKKREIICQKKT